MSVLLPAFPRVCVVATWRCGPHGLQGGSRECSDSVTLSVTVVNCAAVSSQVETKHTHTQRGVSGAVPPAVGKERGVKWVSRRWAVVRLHSNTTRGREELSGGSGGEGVSLL